MKLKLFLLSFLCAGFGIFATAQENLTYQKPPKEILELVDIQQPPSVLMDNAKENMLLLYRNSYKTIAELSEDELRLAGLRINPKTNISSRARFINNIKFKKLTEPEPRQVTGLPENPRLSNFNWSPDEKKMAFTHTTDTGVEVWVLDVAEGEAKSLTDATVNANMGNPISWFRDGSALLVRMLPADRPALIDTEESVPTGPTVTVSGGILAQNRTYQDLLKSKADEFNFETLTTSELYKVNLNGDKSLWKEKAMYRGESFSPDGKYVMVTTIHRPFSYIVPLYRFPSTTDIYDLDGNLVQTIEKTPLIEDLPKGFMATRQGKRNISWRSDQPATLVWAEALDGGDPEKEVPFRDEIFSQDAPFKEKPKSLVKTINRFSGITWGNDRIAIMYDRWWNNRNTKTYVFNPSRPGEEAKVIFDRNYQDRYSDPGDLETEKNKYGQYVLKLDGNTAYLIGDGYSEKGQFPFVDEINLSNSKKERLYQSRSTDKLENIRAVMDARKGELLVRIESKNEYPNYYIRNLKKRVAPMPVTRFKSPFKSLEDVHKEVVTYKRGDGLELSGTLYLPAGYDLNKKEKLPMILWAYPREYKDKNSAAQTTANPNAFTFPYYGSPVYWVTRGYAVLDGAAFPIIGEGDREPNDSFREQLVANAKAAIDAVDALGYIDRERVAVGGHSYGAFMTANLLTHSKLFAAGIARSGAYNRTLTPFGFQSEERNYWEAPEIYNGMSPFMHADKMKTPLLLIHGEADNNSGTYPMQSERYFNALKGFGAPARLVMLPKESHGYAALESILHVLWEQDQWLEKYVKNKNKE
ncbi:S9 family peptidase [Sinomicrobium weinanense]|uniref:S9 family peptidase n=1 Tax=Sinomicrobium weinanense TaxID=2842200 RepID=A0A926JQ79_9FLAO|nr:prolyl oligopeptidase family serine peptidase [Sinomicrobium weinanense]MBC9795303.1 S9 family peptidase [Sinomicrobium weinanense]MBU3125775.1 prolyl oligopeptidase family serine peptidase [Sinomicrobium weinanense]